MAGLGGVLGPWKLGDAPSGPISRSACEVHNGTLWALVQSSRGVYVEDDVTLVEKHLKYAVGNDTWEVVDT